METQVAIPSSQSLALNINTKHRLAEQSRDAALGYAGAACKAAVECGTLLIQAKAEQSGEFLLWLEANCPDISERTAQNYMRVSSKYASALADGSLDFQTLKQLYIATGIMPEPESREHGSDPAQTVAPWVRFTVKLNGLIADLKEPEKEELRRWCLETLKRL